MKTGVMGGTFDPPHIGHTLPVADAAREFGLDRVWFVPNSTPPHKSRPGITDPFHRAAMVALAIQHHPEFLLSTRELTRQQVSYTYDTIVEMQSDFPADRLYFVLGSDSFLEIDTWYRYRELIDRCEFIIINRGSDELELKRNLERLERLLQKNLSRSFHFSRFPHVPVSSTEIRTSLEQGKSIRGLVPAEVESYVRRHGLYIAQGGDSHPLES
jgi:nicotinate-nucleotide adenylyltransferase